MNILIIIRALNIGGGEGHVLNLSIELVKRGHSVTVISAGGSLVKRLEQGGIKHLLCPWISHNYKYNDIVSLYKARKSIYKAISKVNYNIINIHGYMPLVAIAFMRNISSKVINTHHNVDKPAKLAYYIIAKILSIQNITTIFVSNAERNILIKFGFKKVLGHVIWNSIDKNNYNYLYGKINENELTIGTMVRFVDGKGVLELIDAANELINERLISNVKFVLYGDGSLYNKAVKTVRSYSLDSKVFLPGFISNKKDAFENMDIFVLYSKTESLPLSIVEAMSYGIPIIVTDVGGVNEIIEDGVNGTIIKYGDHNGLITSLIKLIKKPGIRINYSLYASKFFISELSNEVQIPKIEELFYSKSKLT